MASLASRFDDSFLERAVAAVQLSRGAWADLFLERASTLRAEWDTRKGLRMTPGLREGFALRRLELGHQRLISEEGLWPERILQVCGSGVDAGHSPATFAKNSEDFSDSTEALRGRLMEELGSALTSRLPPESSCSLTLEWRERETSIAVRGWPIRRNRGTRVVVTCRLAGPSGALKAGLGMGSLEALASLRPVETLHRKLEERLRDEREARDAPQGEFTVILAPGTGGVFFHEACGHALEGDLVLRGSSPFRNLLGERVAPQFVGAMDDSSQPDLEGSYAFDDEGVPCRGTVLIAQGVLKAFLTDRIVGERLGRGSTANGRRESFRDFPLPRMSNAFLMAGDEDPEEILRDTPMGIYVGHMEGGRVDPATGEFHFRATQGSLIERGRLTAPLRPFTVSGNGPAALRGIQRLGNDLSWGDGAGSCGKDGQQVPVAAGIPTLRVASLTVGPG